MTPETCTHVKEDGSRCQVDFALNEKGLCLHHDPDRGHIVRRARKAGGEAAARKRNGGLLDDDLPPLTSHEAAEVWTDQVGRAAATGRITGTAATAALRAVKEWREAREAGKVSERLEELTAALAEWKKTGDPDRVLKLVEGGAA